MPTKNFTTRFSANGPTVIEGADGLGCWPYASTFGHHDRAQRIADALNEAIENEEHHRTGDGPTVEEAVGAEATGWRRMPKAREIRGSSAVDE